ncbi:MAG: DUF72 domain-containing protein [Bryobacterales bacterium]|nr:DUF72 domain-containing protein [Bryobacterales bacterium]MBV9397138.1 DUF72 domain-containing protein [Bryobacterales bacterium]
MSTDIHIGTSGWHYGHWKGPFYPPDLPLSKRFEYYTQHFDIVELNNTFYRLPTEDAVTQWKESSPAQFRFAVKGSRFLTHMKKLKDPAMGLERFFSRIDLLGRKLGPVLFQLPPHWAIDEDRLREFLQALPRAHRYAFEFRDPTWNTVAIYKLLEKFSVAYCIFDLAGFQSPLQVTADFIYIRLHGPRGKYQGSYSDNALNAWLRRLHEWKSEAAYVFFDNDQQGFAVKNALRLKELAGAA